MHLSSSLGVVLLPLALWAPLDVEAGEMQLPPSDTSQASKTPSAAAQPPTGDFKALLENTKVGRRLLG